MRTILIYDFPTRLFHWLFAALFFSSFFIAKNVSDESIVFTYHMLSGLLMCALVLWRITWGIWGSKYAKFSSFVLNLRELKNYFKGIITGSKYRWSGHNPASSWAAVAMMSLAIGLSLTGYLMTTGYKESVEDIHELMANAFMIVVLLHVLGIIVHSVVHKDLIGLSMVDGKKEIFDNPEPIKSKGIVAAIVLVLFISFCAFYLAKSLDGENRTLNLFGQTLQLGEPEEEI